MLNQVQNTHETQKKFNSEVTFPKFFISEFRIIEFENPNSKFYLTKQLLNNVANIDQNNAISSLCKGYQQFGIRYRLFCIHYKTSQAYVIDHETFFSGDDIHDKQTYIGAAYGFLYGISPFKKPKTFAARL